MGSNRSHIGLFPNWELKISAVHCNIYQTHLNMNNLRGNGNWVTVINQLITLTVILWVSGIGKPSLGLTTLYLPTVMALFLMSSVMHLVDPDRRSNLID